MKAYQNHFDTDTYHFDTGVLSPIRIRIKNTDTLGIRVFDTVFDANSFVR
jgi:hypothetical protein